MNDATRGGGALMARPDVSAYGWKRPWPQMRPNAAPEVLHKGFGLATAGPPCFLKGGDPELARR
jgi:hypothetical protein